MMGKEYTNSKPLIRASNLYKIYGNVGVETAVIKGISLTISKGEKLILIGPSGSGKTTLVNLLTSTIKPDAGQIFWQTADRDISKLSKNDMIKIRRDFMSLINQDNNLLPQLTVKQNIFLPAKLTDMTNSEVEDLFEQLIHLLKIEHVLDKNASALSQGEKKRVNIACSLITNPKILIADEPVEGLDPVLAETILDLFDEINKELGTTLLMTTHDQSVAERGTRILELSDGVLSGAHNAAISLVDLVKTRKLVVDNEGRIQIPPDILKALGDPVIFSMDYLDDGIKLSLPDEDEILMTSDEYYECLSCKVVQGPGVCESCGSPTIKIQ